eukprot:scaffold59371_cov36-Tisochrysis_lutea.AAC.2
MPAGGHVICMIQDARGLDGACKLAHHLGAQLGIALIVQAVAPAARPLAEPRDASVAAAIIDGGAKEHDHRPQ